MYPFRTACMVASLLKIRNTGTLCIHMYFVVLARKMFQTVIQDFNVVKYASNKMRRFETSLVLANPAHNTFSVGTCRVST